MHDYRRFLLTTLAGTLLAATTTAFAAEPANTPGMGITPVLPQPDRSHSVENYSRVIGWPEGMTPKAPAGFAVTRFAGGLSSPRALLVLPNGDVLVAESTTNAKPPAERTDKQDGQMRSGSAGVSANRVTLLRDADGDGVAEMRTVLLQGLNQPFGMAFLGGHLYVANTDAVLRYPYTPGQTQVAGPGQKILDLPAGGYNNHWTRNLLPNRDGSKLYVSVGSGSNVAEHGIENEIRRANILEINPDGSGERIVAFGLRNPVGMSLQPGTGQLWAAVNERDMIGDDLVPDYITSVRDGAFYGWPYSYWGKLPDPRLAGQRQDLVERAIAPDYATGSHTATLGIAFYDGAAFGEFYRGGAFIAQRGSWNRQPFSGYKVMFVPFQNGKPSGEAQDFLTGFMPDASKGDVHGRPVGVYVDGGGALLVTDDAGNSVWRVAAAR